MKMFNPLLRTMTVAIALVAVTVIATPASGAVYEKSVPRAEWPRHVNGKSISALPVVREVVQRFKENGRVTVLIRYPGGDLGRVWAHEMHGWLVSFGIPTAYLELEPGAGAGDRLVIEVIDRG